MSETRKLAAILAVDVVGYSRLMGEDEAGRRGECANVPTWRVLCELLMPPSRTAAFPPTCAVRSRDPQFYVARIVLALTSAGLDRKGDAIVALREAKRLRPRLSLEEIQLLVGRRATLLAPLWDEVSKSPQ